MIVSSFMQSCELLETDIDRNTADFGYKLTDKSHPVPIDELKDSFVPAWSLSALWVEVGNVAQFTFEESDSPELIIDRLIELYKTYGEQIQDS